jgi:4-hydroxy-2-oxoheptanedioate aldolase
VRENKFRQALNREGPIFGMGAASPGLVEVIGHWGYDYVFIDSEHATLTVDFHLEELVRAADSANIAVVFRVKGLDEHLVRNALEMGVDAVVIPHIRTVADAETAVSYARFPPKGVRGSAAAIRAANYGAGKDFNWQEFVRKTNEDVVVIGLAEDREFFENIDGIVGVDGLSMVNFGPTDLAMNLGLNLLYDLDAPPILAAMEQLAAKAAPRNIPLMCPAAPPNLERVRKMIKQGIKAITLRNQYVTFNNVCKQYLNEIVAPIREEK